MGLEAECTVRVGRKTSTGKALLESERLLFRGEFRLDIPFADMKGVTVDGGALVVKTADQETHLELGEVLASRWMRLIKEPKGLFEKLEVGAESRVAVVDVHDSLFLTALRERTAGVVEARVPEGAPIVFFGAETRDALRKLPLLRARMAETGALWVVRPKGSRWISEAEVLEAIRLAGFADTKVVAFSKTHTAHKAVVPLELRGAPRRPAFVTLPPPAPGMTPPPPAGRWTPAPPAPPSRAAPDARPAPSTRPARPAPKIAKAAAPKKAPEPPKKPAAPKKVNAKQAAAPKKAAAKAKKR
ncbi:MAG TPA: hypothetical protein VHV30_05925 [Polyangiaceae bacterium]|jgi:hypothetical protein|nr:hypothetical protein [Polyangiaceae bacterium]